VLEYLGVPHDIDLKAAAAPAKKEAPVKEDDSAPPQEDIQALYDAANDLPSDDPQSAAAKQAAAVSTPSAPSPASVTADARTSAPAAQSASPAPQPAAQTPADTAQNGTKTILLPAANQLRVPTLTGMPVRQVIEQAGAAGLEVEINGNGTCREQAPAPGAMVGPGTKIVVRCAR
jgi:cell division protein FtsI (penicillin-binding protein 3)